MSVAVAVLAEYVVGPILFQAGTTAAYWTATMEMNRSNLKKVTTVTELAAREDQEAYKDQKNREGQ